MVGFICGRYWEEGRTAAGPSWRKRVTRAASCLTSVLPSFPASWFITWTTLFYSTRWDNRSCKPKVNLRSLSVSVFCQKNKGSTTCVCTYKQVSPAVDYSVLTWGNTKQGWIWSQLYETVNTFLLLQKNEEPYTSWAWGCRTLSSVPRRWRQEDHCEFFTVWPGHIVSPYLNNNSNNNNNENKKD